MSSYAKKLSSDPKPSQKQEVYNISQEDYDATYWLANKILSIMCVRLTLLDAQWIRNFESMMFWFYFMDLFIATILELINMVLTASSGTLVELFAMMPCVGYLLVALSKAYKIHRLKPIYQNLVHELRDMWPVGQVTEVEHQIIFDSLKNLRNVIKGYFTCSMTLASIFVLPPIMILIKEWTGGEKGQRSLQFFFWFPFDPLQDTIYEIVVAVQSWQCFSSVGFMLCGDLLFFIFLNHITTQFSLLTVKINKMFFVKPDNQLLDTYPLGANSKDQFTINKDYDMDNAEMEKKLEEKLVEIIHRHQALIRLSKDVENIYTFSLLVNFINSSIIICFCLFCVTFVEKWNVIIYKVFFMTAILQIWIHCWYGQKLLDTSAGIGDALYNSGWYILSNKIKKSILIMIHRSQKPVYITTFGFSIVSLQSYGTILKTSWSYFTLLINMYKE